MKIACCFAGQPRSFKAGFDYYKKNLFDQYPNKVDVFIHTWNGNWIEEIIDLYTPRMIKVDDTLSGPFDTKYTKTPDAKKWPPRFTVSSYYSIFEASYLKTKNELVYGEYDWVIKTRFDFALNARIPFEQLSDRNAVYVPGDRWSPNRDFCNDQFAFGSSPVMNKYMSTFLNMEHFYNQGVTMIGEDMLSANLKFHGLIGERMIYCDMNHPFPPGPHNGSAHSLIREDLEYWRETT